jgi:hypothetical protein
MKSMSDKSLGWGSGNPKSSSFFPEQPHVKEMGLPGKVNMGDYPDNANDLVQQQSYAAKQANQGKIKPGFRY